MKSFMKTFAFMGTLLCGSVASRVSAHEVYVLSQDEIAKAIATHRPDFGAMLAVNQIPFIISVLVAFVIIGIVFFISYNKTLRRTLNPFLRNLKKAAPTIAQLTLGFSVFSCGFYQAAFGIEIPLAQIFGSSVHLVDEILMLLGGLLIAGLFPRTAAFCILVFFTIITSQYGFYMLNYSIYFGEALAILVFGAGYTLYKNQYLHNKFRIKLPQEKLHDYSFTMMRIFLGLSLIFASLYAKFFYAELAYETVLKYQLTDYFPFDPLFIVVGALLTEVGIGLFMILGLQIRFVSLVFLGFLFLSLSFFGESVWPHLVLIGTTFALFLHGYDKNTLMVALTKEKSHEPVL